MYFYRYDGSFMVWTPVLRRLVQATGRVGLGSGNWETGLVLALLLYPVYQTRD